MCISSIFLKTFSTEIWPVNFFIYNLNIQLHFPDDGSNI